MRPGSWPARTGICIALLALAGSAWAESVGPEKLDGTLDGVWRLERRDGFEEYMDATGAGWVRRQLARMNDTMIQRIRQDGERFRIILEVSFRTMTLDLTADGETVTRTETLSGEAIEAIARVEGETLRVFLSGDEGRRRIDRRVEDGRLVMTLHHLEANATSVWTFVRVEAEPE